MMRSLLFFALLCMLSACQTVPKTGVEQAQWQTDADYFKGQVTNTASLNTWNYSAKVGVTTPRAKEQANLVWRFSDQAHSVRLFGPLGVGAIRIEFDRFGVVLSDNKGVLHRGRSAEELLTRIVGWPIPIDALNYWLFALPKPDQPFRYQLDDAGQVSVLEQQGWSIQYSNYKPYGADQVLPRKLVATKQLVDPQQPGDQGAVVVKLITKGWQW